MVLLSFIGTILIELTIEPYGFRIGEEMKFLNNIYVILIFLVMSPFELIAQAELSTYRIDEAPNFYYETVTSRASDGMGTNLDIYVKISYDELQFLKSGNTFTAKYEISVIIFNASGDQQDGRTVEELIEVADFDDTNSRELFGVTKVNFLLKKDSYRVNIGVMDLDTRKTGSRRITLMIPDYSDKLSISDIIFIDKVEETDSNETIMYPNISGGFISESSEFKAYYEIYGVDGMVEIKNEVKDMKGITIYSDKFERRSTDGMIKEIVSIVKDDLRFNKYKFYVSVSKGKKKVSKSKTFQVRWFGMSESITDLDMAVNFLRYIATKKVYEKMVSSESEEKRKLFIKFWKKRDPSPETETNELMKEYYRRIQYSNEHFATFQEGWKADMGMVFILFGHPNDIERHPFDINSKPYEVWYYYDINRNFVFQDFSGFGEYRLVTPLYDLSRSDF